MYVSATRRIEIFGETPMATRRADIADLIALSSSACASERTEAVREMCPCEVRAHLPTVWRRLLELADDPDPKVRRSVLHNLCDGSPAEYRGEVIESLERLSHDPDHKVRRQARHVLAGYRRRVG